LLRSGVSLVTTSFVVDEIVTFLNARRKHAEAVSIGNLLITNQNVELMQVDDALFMEGWDYFVRHADKTYSLTDCISFVVMEQRGLRQALTFDQHFVQAGFECLPGAASGS
jgi:predicted nucleic acid-binding protein